MITSVQERMRFAFIYNRSLGLPCTNGFLPGDMDKDGRLTSSDALCTHELSLSICPTSCGKDCSISLCDVNGDNKCTKKDVLSIFHRSSKSSTD